MRHGLLALASLGLALILACSSSERRSGFVNDGQKGGDQDGFGDGPVPCSGLACKQVSCDDGKTTTLVGKVYDPAGSNPLYNVMVYIPGGENPDDLPPLKDAMTDGVACEACASIVLNPLVSALTNTAGEFRLENVPVDKDVPVVIQIGKWRRKFNIDVTKKCAENQIDDDGEFRLPKNGKEGDMPQIAVAAGGADALECLLRGVGIDTTEFVKGPATTGHIHVFNGSGGYYTGAPSATELWGSLDTLAKYDVVLLSCEGSEATFNKGEAAYAAMAEYLARGGRLFTTHYHYTWFSESPDPGLRNIGSFQSTASGTGGSTHVINTSFPKGEAFGKWLEAVGASPTPGHIDLTQIRDSVVSLYEPGVPWITNATNSLPRYFSVNVPVGETDPAKQCGRAVFSDLHITGGSGATSVGACSVSPGGLDEQQRALEFFLFDLSACVSDDKVPPSLPK